MECYQMRFLPEVDYIQTRKNVARWFDTEYSKYQRLANIPVISSVRLSLAPRSTASANSVEDMNIKRAHAKEVLKFVEDVLNSLDERQRTILKARYIKKMMVWQIEQLISLGESTTKAYHRLACYEFAQAMDMLVGTQLVAYKKPSE